MKHVAIILLNFNGETDTIDCLKSLRYIPTSQYKISIIVVDNGSVKSSTDYVKKHILLIDFKQISCTLLQTHKNLGFAGGNNEGIRYALSKDAEYIILLNNDTIVDKQFVHELVVVAGKDEKIGVVAPKIYFAKGFEFHKERYKKTESGKVLWYAGGIMDYKNVYGHHRGVDEIDSGQYDKIEETDFASGCCLLIKRSVVERVGLLNEKYFLYYEESDWNMRIKKAGYKIMFSPKAMLWHKNAQSTGGSGSQLQDYYITRNRLIFGLKYAPLRSKIALLQESVKLLKNGRPWQKKGVKDFYTLKFGKGSYS